MEKQRVAEHDYKQPQELRAKDHVQVRVKDEESR